MTSPDPRATAARPTRPMRPARPMRLARLARLLGAVLAAAALATLSVVWPGTPAQAASYTRISGVGSSWAGNALNDWTTAIKAQGVTVDYSPDGSSIGRDNFARGLADFAVSEIPYKGDTADPQDTTQPPASYAMLPVVAGGTAFMYNLPVNGQRYGDLKLNQATLAKIFAGEITTWNDPAIKATNPGVNLPAQRITVVVRSEGSGATAQFTLWMKRQFPHDYAALCKKTGCNAANATSYYPTQGLSNFVAQKGSDGVTSYTTNVPYTIDYDEYSYAQGVQFPVAQIQNKAGFYVIPTQYNVAVALTQAKINMNPSSPNYLSQDLSNVYEYKDPRTYPISMYTYGIEPTATRGNFSTAKGATLAYFETYALCQGQQTMGALGYSPLPMNLVIAAMDQVSKVPGIDAATKQTISATKRSAQTSSGNPCGNPTFKPGDSPKHNVLVDEAPFPAGCDAACQAPWTNAYTANGHNPPPNKSGNTNPSDPSNPGNPNNPSNTTSTGPSGPTSTGPGTTTGPGTPGTTTSTGPTATGPGSAPGGPAPSAGATPACDADTGVCAAPNTTTDGTQLVASPAVISGQSTWGIAQIALVLCFGLGILLVFAPPLASRLLQHRTAVPVRAAAPIAGGQDGPPAPSDPAGPDAATDAATDEGTTP